MHITFYALTPLITRYVHIPIYLFFCYFPNSLLFLLYLPFIFIHLSAYPFLPLAIAAAELARREAVIGVLREDKRSSDKVCVCVDSQHLCAYICVAICVNIHREMT